MNDCAGYDPSTIPLTPFERPEQYGKRRMPTEQLGCIEKLRLRKPVLARDAGSWLVPYVGADSYQTRPTVRYAFLPAWTSRRDVLRYLGLATKLDPVLRLYRGAIPKDATCSCLGT